MIRLLIFLFVFLTFLESCKRKHILVLQKGQVVKTYTPILRDCAWSEGFVLSVSEKHNGVYYEVAMAPSVQPCRLYLDIEGCDKMLALLREGRMEKVKVATKIRENAREIVYVEKVKE